DYHYRLRITEGPWVDFVVPAAVQAGGEGQVVVYGRKLPGGSAAGPHWLDGRPLETLTVRAEAPLERAGLFTRFGGDRLPPSAKVDLFDFWLPGRGAGVPAPLGLARGTVLVEAEPNDEPQKAQAVPVPCDLTGQFAAEYDRDWVEFEAK